MRLRSSFDCKNCIKGIKCNSQSENNNFLQGNNFLMGHPGAGFTALEMWR